MGRQFRRLTVTACLCLSILGLKTIAQAATPTAQQALKLRPVQSGIEYDIPQAENVARATIKAENISGRKGWVIRDLLGQILRQFVDTNGDNVVDQWSYYKDGLEVYRDIDRNFNGKADEHRWLNTAGSRWGLDSNEDGNIDVWKRISAEEVSAEAVHALASSDARRFTRLLLTSAEINSLGLGGTKAKELSQRVLEASKQFTKQARGKKKLVAPKTKWVHFGATQPGIVPVGSYGSNKDLLVYENVVVLTEADGQSGELQLGTVIRVGNVWRLVDLPRRPSGDDPQLALSGIFFQASMRTPTGAALGSLSGSDAKMQQLLVQLEKLDQHASGGSPAQVAKVHASRADLLQEIAGAAPAGEDRDQWLRQLADILSAGAQSGEYPEGAKRLRTLHDKVRGDKSKRTLAAYYEFRYLSADYLQKLQMPNADFAKVQSGWLESLEKYVGQYPKSSDSAEAMMQLAMAEEFAGQDSAAKKWYGQVVDRFSGSPLAIKATGAKRRIDSVGKKITLRGKSIDGRAIDLSRYRGKVVLIHYWSTTCEPCKVELAQLKELQARYGKSGFALVGVSLDNRAEDLTAYLKTNRLPWPQMFEPGGLDSRLANEMGIQTLPTMILIGKQGKVVNRNIHVTQLETELKTQLR